MFLGILEKGILKLYEYYEYDRKLSIFYDSNLQQF